jgi:energy-coupling factor transporter ATP-binding protein EcfA2
MLSMKVAELLTGTLILGRTGSGKSKMLQHIVRQLIDMYVSIVMIDAEGDLSEDVFADIIEEVRIVGSEARLNRVHYLRIDWKKQFTIDPFRYEGMPDHPKAFRAWLTQQCDKMANATIRMMGEVSFDDKPRLKRVLTSLLFAIGTTCGPNKARLPLASIFILLNFEHPKFEKIYSLIKPSLPRELRQDFDLLLGLKNRPNDFLGQTESTINRLRSSLTVIVQGIFSEVGKQTLNLKELIRNRAIVIFNLRDSQYFSPHQADQLGKIVIYMLISAMQSVEDRCERVACALIVDECHRFITEDVMVGLARGRKWGLMTILATQLYSSLEMVQEGFGDMVLGSVSNVFCFQQRLERDLDVLIPYLFRPNYVLDELYREVDRHRGYQWFDVVEHAENWSTTTTVQEAWSRVLSTSKSNSFLAAFGKAISKALATSSNWSKSKAITKSRSTTNSQSDMTSMGAGQSLPLLSLDPGGGHIPMPTVSTFQNHGQVNGSADSAGEADTAAEANGGGFTVIEGDVENQNRAFGQAEAETVAHGHTVGVAKSTSRGGSRSYKRVPLARIEAEAQPTGQFRFPIDMQNETFKTWVATFKQGVAAIRRDATITEIIEVPFVHDPFPDPKLKKALIELYLNKLQALHPYWQEPDLSDDAFEQTLDDFIANASYTPSQPRILPPPQNNGPF